VKVLPEKLLSYMLKNLINVDVVLRTGSEKRNLKFLAESFCFLLGHDRLIYEVDLVLDQYHRDFTALIVDRQLPLFDVLEAVPVSSREAEDASVCPFVVASRDRVELLLASRVPEIILHLVVQLLDVVLLLEKVHA
jgi:hypothetical protein